MKNVLQRLSAGMLAEVTGFAVTRWLNVELPEVRSLRADLLGETADGQLVHIELQSTNDPDMVFRMAEYGLAIRRRFGSLPAQVVLYVGHAPAKMKTSAQSPHMTLSCKVVDARSLDAEPWLASDRIEDNIVAILLRLGNEKVGVQRILRSIAACPPEARPDALAELLALSGLRKMSDIIIHEARDMPILDDIMDHEVIGPLLRQGERRVILRVLSRRFGPLPDSAVKRLENMSSADLDRIADDLITASSLEELLP